MSQQDQRFSVLCEDDLAQMLQALQPIRVQWYDFGLNLKLPVADLELIKVGTGIENRLREVLTKLLQKDPLLTWPDIVEALVKINRHDIAREVNRVYCPSYVSLGLVWVLRPYA